MPRARRVRYTSTRPWKSPRPNSTPEPSRRNFRASRFASSVQVQSASSRASRKSTPRTFMTLSILFSAIAYNTKLVKAEDAPKGFQDLLDGKWSGKLVKAHPGYSGLILTATHAIARELGWAY